jgi:hypothetical protein
VGSDSAQCSPHPCYSAPPPRVAGLFRGSYATQISFPAILGTSASKSWTTPIRERRPAHATMAAMSPPSNWPRNRLLLVIAHRESDYWAVDALGAPSRPSVRCVLPSSERRSRWCCCVRLPNPSIINMAERTQIQPLVGNAYVFAYSCRLRDPVRLAFVLRTLDAHSDPTCLARPKCGSARQIFRVQYCT